ncbi:MAG: hypothetical protein ACK5P5_03910 [Pseudobdellovibrionaceae bacterium]
MNRIYSFQPEGRTNREVRVICRKAVPPHQCQISPRPVMSDRDADIALEDIKEARVQN